MSFDGKGRRSCYRHGRPGLPDQKGQATFPQTLSTGGAKDPVRRDLVGTVALRKRVHRRAVWHDKPMA